MSRVEGIFQSQSSLRRQPPIAEKRTPLQTIGCRSHSVAAAAALELAAAAAWDEPKPDFATVAVTCVEGNAGQATDLSSDCTNPTYTQQAASAQLELLPNGFLQKQLQQQQQPIQCNRARHAVGSHVDSQQIKCMLKQLLEYYPVRTKRTS
jgi:hypothetical protein